MARVIVFDCRLKYFFYQKNEHLKMFGQLRTIIQLVMRKCRGQLINFKSLLQSGE